MIHFLTDPAHEVPVDGTNCSLCGYPAESWLPPHYIRHVDGQFCLLNRGAGHRRIDLGQTAPKGIAA